MARSQTFLQTLEPTAHFASPLSVPLPPQINADAITAAEREMKAATATQPALHENILSSAENSSLSKLVIESTDADVAEVEPIGACDGHSPSSLTYGTCTLLVGGC
jgi:hypothetical protein